MYTYYFMAARLCQQITAVNPEATAAAVPVTWHVTVPGRNICLHAAIAWYSYFPDYSTSEVNQLQANCMIFLFFFGVTPVTFFKESFSLVTCW